MSAEAGNNDPTKKKAKHGKQAAKSTGLSYQFQIMLSMGVPLEEIQCFADPSYWIHYWPPIATVRYISAISFTWLALFDFLTRKLPFLLCIERFEAIGGSW